MKTIIQEQTIGEALAEFIASISPKEREYMMKDDELALTVAKGILYRMEHIRTQIRTEEVEC